MFLRPTEEELENFKPDWHVISAPGLKLDPAECGTRQHNAAIVSFKHKMILIAGTGYTGETKKGIFTILNYILPHEKNVLSMHCSANMGDNGDTAIFFGLSGTGKTTLSADPNRKLIGDDEHGWTADNIFNFEGGCYAKTINLTEEKEPEIFNAIRPGHWWKMLHFFPAPTKSILMMALSLKIQGFLIPWILSAMQWNLQSVVYQKIFSFLPVMHLVYCLLFQN